MAEKKTRRERLSARDHNRAARTADAMLMLLDNMQKQYPNDVDLVMADRGLRAFAQRAYEMGADADGPEPSPSPLKEAPSGDPAGS